MSRKQSMPTADLAIKVPRQLVSRASDLIPMVQASDAFKWVPISQAAVLRLALDRGLALMEEQYSESAPAPTTPPPKRRERPKPVDPLEAGAELPSVAFRGTRRRPSRMTPPATPAAERLREWRTGEDLTQTQAAKRVGIAQSGYSAIETGKRQPTAEQARKLQDLAGIAPDAWTAPDPELEED